MVVVVVVVVVGEVLIVSGCLVDVVDFGREWTHNGDNSIQPNPKEKTEARFRLPIEVDAARNRTGKR